MDKEKWLSEAKRYAKHAYCYEGMVDEFPESFDAEYSIDTSPYEAVDVFAENVGLDRQDGFYGINSNVKFVRCTE